MNDIQQQRHNGSQTEKLVYFPRADGSRIPFKVYSSREIYQLEQERIFRGPVWSFVAMEAEIAHTNDFKSTFVGDTPVVVARNQDESLSVWVNRCAHRGAMVCRTARGNARSHICAYHQWSYDTRGNLRGVPFRNGVKGAAGMPADFDPKEHGLQKLRVESYRGLMFATLDDRTPSLNDYLGPQMREGLTASSTSPSSISAAHASIRNQTGSSTPRTSAILITRRFCIRFSARSISFGHRREPSRLAMSTAFTSV